jgi:hypothetical protein
MLADTARSSFTGLRKVIGSCLALAGRFEVSMGASRFTKRSFGSVEGRVAIAGKAIGGTVGVLINVMDVATRKTTAVAQTVAAVARTTSQSGAIVVQTYFRTIRTTDEMV